LDKSLNPATAFVVIDPNLLIGTGAIGPCRPKSFARECVTLAAEVQPQEGFSRRREFQTYGTSDRWKILQVVASIFDKFCRTGTNSFMRLIRNRFYCQVSSFQNFSVSPPVEIIRDGGVLATTQLGPRHRATPAAHRAFARTEWLRPEWHIGS
jgi:hypothetical protein